MEDLHKNINFTSWGYVVWHHIKNPWDKEFQHPKMSKGQWSLWDQQATPAMPHARCKAPDARCQMPPIKLLKISPNPQGQVHKLISLLPNTYTKYTFNKISWMGIQ